MNIAYNVLQNTGLINHIDDNFIHHKFDRVFNFNQFNKFFFGKEVLDDVSKTELLNQSIIFYDDNGKSYIKFKKVGDYIMYISKNLDFENGNYILFNYYNLIGKSNFSIKQKKIYNFFESIKEKLLEISNKNDTESYIKNIAKFILCYIGVSYFKGYIISELDDVIVVKFDTLNKPFYISLCNNKSDYNSNLIGLDNKLDNLSCNSITIKIIDDVMKNDKYTFMYHRLLTINNNESFTKLYLDSWKKKEEYIISSDLFECIISFASPKKRIKYEKYFIEKFKDKNLYKLREDKIFLNFDGINNYLLNIENNYLINDCYKDRINELYLKSSVELMKSLEELYKHTI